MRPFVLRDTLRDALAYVGGPHLALGRLDEARRALKSLRGGRHAHRFYRAGFVLVGDGG